MQHLPEGKVKCQVDCWRLEGYGFSNFELQIYIKNV